MQRLMCLLIAAAALWAGDKNPARPVPAGQGADKKVAIQASAYYTREQITALLGEDPGVSVVVVAVQFAPAPGETIVLNRDDFLLRSDRDGQRSRPLEPSQIAGTSVMVVKSVGGEQGRPMSERRRTGIGIPGVGGTTLPGTGTPTAGVATADTSSASASIENRPTPRENPLLTTLKNRILPEGEVTKPVEGLLYFLIEGKLRAKDIELVYRKAPPRVSVRFYEPGKEPDATRKAKARN